MRTIALFSLPFREAAQTWLESREGHLSPRTLVDYGNYLKTLSAFFGDFRLPEITGDQVRAYQKMRRSTAGPVIINHECMVLMQMRERIGAPIVDYEALRMPKDWQSPGRRLTPAEEARLEKVFRAAAEVPKWSAAALTSLLSMKSGIGQGEMRSLKLQDCSLDPPEIQIPMRGAKRVSRARLVVLNESAAWALERLVRRSIQTCGSTSQSHFLLPAQNKDHSFDPTRPCSDDSWRTALGRLLKMAEVKVRPHDFRHHAVSVALSNPNVTRQGARAFFGWINDKMFQRYGHAELAELRVVAAAIDKKPASKEPSVETLLKKVKKSS